jgi:hypothetical protein
MIELVLTSYVILAWVVLVRVYEAVSAQKPSAF